MKLTTITSKIVVEDDYQTLTIRKNKDFKCANIYLKDERLMYVVEMFLWKNDIESLIEYLSSILQEMNKEGKDEFLL